MKVNAMPERSLPPIVLWQYRGDPNTERIPSTTTARMSRAVRKIMVQSVESAVTAAAYASGIMIYPNWTLTAHLKDTDVPNPSHWTAYTCSNEDATRTTELIRLVYGVWLSVHGDNKMLDTVTKQVKQELSGIDYARPELICAPAVLGRLVVPDLVNGVLPGAPWKPSLATMHVPAYPRMPDKV